MALDVIIGIDFHKTIVKSLQSTDPTMQANVRKLYVLQWMCIHGFLSEEFPLRQKYIPHHIQYGEHPPTIPRYEPVD